MKPFFATKYRVFSVVAVSLIIVTILLVISFRSCNHRAMDLDGIIKSGRLRVFTDSSSLGFVVRGDSVYGFQYEIMKQFANSLGVELQVTQQNNINEGIEGVQDGEYDIIANFLPNTADLNKKLLFTEPLFSSRLMLVQQKSKTDSLNRLDINSQMELANDTIYTTYKSPDNLRLKHLATEIADTVYLIEMKNASMEQMIEYVSRGKIKNTICPEYFKRKVMTKYDNLDISIPLGFTQNYSWAVHKGSKNLQNKLNDFLNDFIGSETYWELYNKYY